MLIAIDIREAAGGKRAGKGWYAFQLVQEILTQDKKNQYILYTDQPFPAWSHFENAIQKFFPPHSLVWHYNVMRDIKKNPPDIFFAPTSYIIAAFGPKNLKTIITVHDLVAWYVPDRHNKKATFVEHRTLPTAVKKACYVTTVSESTKTDLQKLFQIPQEKISVIHCAAGRAFHEMENEEKTQAAVKLKTPEKFILSVGTLEPRKNFITLLKSFAKLRKKFPEFHCIIIGSKGWNYREIFKTIETLKIGDFVHFPDYVSEENLVKYYNLASFFVYPSLYEGFGIPVLEAMQCGCPVITSNVSSLPEVAGSSAILINPKNTDELSKKMEEIIMDEKIRETMRQKGLEQARKFSWRKSAAEFIELFQKI